MPPVHATAPPWRPIRSYVRREGRLTRAQGAALRRLWPAYGIQLSGESLRFHEIFGRRAPVVMEIGFGNGETLAAMAEADPGSDHVGVEVHRPGIGHILQTIETRQLSNLRIIAHDAVEVLQRHVPAGSLDRVQLFFPDPWPKKRHHKRRIVQPAFVALVGRALRPGGQFHLATDWEDYAQHMLAVMADAPGFVNQSGSGRFTRRPDSRHLTRFERRGLRLGHQVRDLIYRKR